MKAAALIALLIVAVLVVPVAGTAQPASSVPRIGFLAPNSPTEPQVVRSLQALRQGLRELGYAEGQNLAIEFRWAEGKYDRLPGLAAELVGLKVNVIVAGTPPAVQAAKQATKTIPIVMAVVADPVGLGFVDSLARPGGNVTGLSSIQTELVGKRMEVLKEVVPKVSLVALLGNPANPNYSPLVRQAKPADLPVEQPTKFELAINLKTAKAIGLTIPRSLLLQADEVIQ